MSSPFDEAKYNALLKGLEVSVVRLSELNNEHRIDAEYFSKENLFEIKKLSDFGTLQIGDIANVTDGIHTSIDYDENSHVNLISATSPKENIFDLSRGAFISEKAHAENPRTALRKNDVIISTVGTIGNCAVVDDSILPANSDRHVGIIRIKNDYSPYVLSTFLLSKYGKMQTLRESTGNVQLNLFIYKLRELQIPNFSADFQQKIESLVKSAHAKLADSKSIYAQAEDTLLSELGLKDWQPKSENTSVKTLSDFKASGRLDAEFYQPKYDELEAKIKSVPYKTISELQTFNARGVQPDYIPDGTVSVVNSKHILENGLDYDNFEKTTTDFLKDNEKAAIKQNDILIYTTGANIGRTQPYLLSEPALASNHVNILRPSNVNPLYAAFVLNSKIGRLQTEKACTGSAQAELYPSDIEKFLLPILPQKTQEQIAELVQKSFELRTESKRLLEEAKKMVEKEIEK